MLPVELTRTSRAHNRQLRSTVCESPAETLERGGVLHSDPRSFLAAVWSPPVPRLLALVLAILITLLAASTASARCVCACVNGEAVALCEGSIDLSPICSPRVCPIVPPRIRPLAPPTIPPVGTEFCQSEQVLNPATGRYEWREVCR